jgi:hypothetical protein
MTTATAISEARTMAERLLRLDPSGGRVFLGANAQNGVSHENYSVGYFADNSILIWAKGEGCIVLDGAQTYYRDTVEHLARCLGTFTKAERAAMIGGKSKWIDGIHWSADGECIGL